MSTVTSSIASRDDVTNRAVQAFDGERGGARISFASVDLLWRTLTRERWDLLQLMTGHGPMSVAQAARRLSRDQQSVAFDAEALRAAGILDQHGHDFIFPFDVVHVDFKLTKAA